MPGVSPSLTLRAVIDNGAGGTPVTTGSLRFTIDAHHLAPGAWTSLTAATAGTQLGTMTSDISGPEAQPLRFLGQGRDASGQYVRAGLTVPRSTAVVIGSDTIPMIIRRTANGAITFTLDAHVAVGKYAATSIAATLKDVTLVVAQRHLVRRQGPRAHSQSGQEHRTHQYGEYPGLRPARLRHAAHGRQHGQCDGAPAKIVR